MKVIIAMYLMTFLLSFSALGPSLYPGIVEMDLKNGNGQERFTVFNQNNVPKKYKITIKNTDNQGNTSELSPHLKVFPKYMNLNPNESQEIRVIATKFPRTQDGEYRSSLTVEELESTIDKDYEINEESSDMGAKISFLINIDMAVYAYIGEVTEEIETQLTTSDNKLVGKIINKGNVSFPIDYIIEDSLGRDILQTSLVKLIRGESYDVNIGLPKGAYRIKLISSKTKKELAKISL